MNMMTIVMTKLQAAFSEITLSGPGHRHGHRHGHGMTMAESKVFNFNHQLLRVRLDHVMDRCLSKRDEQIFAQVFAGLVFLLLALVIIYCTGLRYSRPKGSKEGRASSLWQWWLGRREG